MKIAIVADEGATVSRHFGRAEFYAVLTVQSGEIAEREIRPKFSPHATLVAHEDPESGPHGTSPRAQARHDQMAWSIGDCSAVVCGGMGQGAHERMRANGIRSIVTDMLDIDEAALACASGAIVDHAELLH